MFTRHFMSKHLAPMVKYAISAALLVCLVVVQAFAEDLTGDTTKTNLTGSENINIGAYTLTLANTVSSEFSGDISGSGQIIITKPNWNSTTQLKLSKEGGYSYFTGSVTIQAPGETEEDSHAKGVLLTAANIFYNASSITNDGTLIVSANQVLPNLSGSGEIQIESDVNTLTFNNTSDTDTNYSGSLSGPGGYTTWNGNIIKTGSGKLTFSHDNGLNFGGSVTVQEGTLELDGTEMFRYVTNSSVVTNNGTIIVGGGGRQFLPNLNGRGNLEIDNGISVNSYYIQDAEFSGIISGPGNFVKQGPGTLTLSGANTISGEIKIEEGKIIFTGDAIVATGEIDGSTNGHVEYKVDVGTQTLYIPADIDHVDVKTITKTGDGVLQIYEGAAGCVRADSFVVSSGRIDYQGYFQSDMPGLGSFDVEEGVIFSPGLTVNEYGEPINTIGKMEITNGVSLNLKSGAIALFEFDDYNEDPTSQNFDKIVTEDVASVFAPNSTSIIDLAFLNNDAWKWATEGAEYHIVFDYNFPDGDYNHLLREQYRDYFSLVGKNNDGLYLIGKGAPEPPTPPYLAVPEPSSWALLIGSALTFLFFLKKKRG